MAKKIIVRLAVVGLLAGIIISSFFHCTVGILVITILLLALICWIGKRRQYIVLLLFFLLGWWRTNLMIVQRPAMTKSLDIEAVVEYRDFVADQQKLRLRSLTSPLPGAVIASVAHFPVYNVGDIMRLRCTPQSSVAGSDIRLLRRDQMQGVAVRCRTSQVTFIRYQASWSTPFFRFKDYIITTYDHLLPGPVAGLMQAMIVNERGGVSDDTTTNFSRSGLSHVVAISGMNMTLLIIAGRSFLTALGLRRKYSSSLLIVVLILYVMIIGSPASAVRAAVMSSTLLIAQLVRRPVDIMHLLTLVAGVLAIINPLAVVYDVGWQLSFLALTGLVWWTPWWTKVLSSVPERWSLRELMSATLAAQMFTWPLILYYFQVWPLWFLPANIVVVPLVGPIMIIGLLLPLIWWVPVIGSAASLIITLMIRWVLLVVTLVGTARWSVLPLPFSVVALIFSAGAMIIITKLINEKIYRH